MLCPGTCVTRPGRQQHRTLVALGSLCELELSPTTTGQVLAFHPPGGTFCLPVGGGISSYADNPAGAGQSLVGCLEQALRDVPRESHAGTPLYLGATAGMRLLK